MKISVPKPCNENWDKMLPEDQGRFCLKCTKTVVDFSNKTKEEVHAFFRETTEKVCGRFESSQLEQVKTRILPSFLNVTRTQKFAFALYLVFGSFLFSCSGNNNDKNIVGKIENPKKDKDSITKSEINNTSENFVEGEVSVASDTLFQNKKHSEEKQFLKGKVIKQPTIQQETLKGDVMVEPEIQHKTTGIPIIDDDRLD